MGDGGRAGAQYVGKFEKRVCVCVCARARGGREEGSV